MKEVYEEVAYQLEVEEIKNLRKAINQGYQIIDGSIFVHKFKNIIGTANDNSNHQHYLVAFDQEEAASHK